MELVKFEQVDTVARKLMAEKEDGTLLLTEVRRGIQLEYKVYAPLTELCRLMNEVIRDTEWSCDAYRATHKTPEYNFIYKVQN